MTPELNMLYVDSEAIGYGRLGVKLADALIRRGVDIYNDLDVPQPAENHIARQAEGRRHKKCNVVAWVSTPGHATGWWDEQVPVIFTMWEACRLPEAYREYLHHFETVLVPSDHNVDLFSLYHPNVKKVLLGIDTEQWHFRPRQTPGMTFDFLIGGSGARKGTDLAFKAFLRAFPDGSWGDGPIPQLIMKNPKGEDFAHPRVSLVTGRISAQAELDLYAASHCYVQPSRGEGFGLQPLQAIAQGMPTILTDAHGHKSFSHLGYGINATMSTSSYFIYGDAGDWWEPDLDELIDRMRWVYDNYDEACAFTAAASEEAHRTFTWENCADQFVEGIGLDKLTTPYKGTSTWVAPEPKVYLCILKRNWRADVAGQTYMFKAGESYYVPADVKRILFEGDLLDPRCLETFQQGQSSGLMDTGLTVAQAARIGRYSADHGFCPTCDQQLNSAPVRADIAEIEMRLEARGWHRADIEEVVYGKQLDAA